MPADPPADRSVDLGVVELQFRTPGRPPRRLPHRRRCWRLGPAAFQFGLGGRPALVKVLNPLERDCFAPISTPPGPFAGSPSAEIKLGLETGPGRSRTRVRPFSHWPHPRNRSAFKYPVTRARKSTVAEACVVPVNCTVIRNGPLDRLGDRHFRRRRRLKLVLLLASAKPGRRHRRHKQHGMPRGGNSKHFRIPSSA